MDDDQIVNTVADALVSAGIAENNKMFIGRVYPVKGEAWTVSLRQPAESYGGNNARHKVRYYVDIRFFTPDAEKAYGATKSIASALASLRDNPQIIDLTLSGLTDLDIAESETRAFSWTATIETFAPGWLDWTE